MPGGYVADLYINGQKVPVDFRQLREGDTLRRGDAKFDGDDKFMGHELMVTRNANSESSEHDPMSNQKAIYNLSTGESLFTKIKKFFHRR